MQINSTNPNPILGQTVNTSSKNSSKDIEAEKKQLDNEIQGLEQKKASLNKEIDSIKGDFAPPKPKDEMIRPLKDEIQVLDAKIQQKQAEKMKKQAECIKETSNDNAGKKTNSIKKDDEANKSISTSGEEKDKSTIEQLNNLTLTGIINEAKVKSSLENSTSILSKENLSTEVPNDSESIISINEQKSDRNIKNALAVYKLIENGDLEDSTTTILA